MWLPELEQMIVGSPWSSLSPGLDGSRHSEELVCALIPLFIWFFSAPQWPTFSSVEHRSLNLCWCFPACFQIQMLGEWRGSVVEEWARAVCTELVPAKPGMELDVPGVIGKLWLCRAEYDIYLPALFQNWSAGMWVPAQSLSQFPCSLPSSAISAMHEALHWELVQDRRVVAGGQWPCPHEPGWGVRVWGIWVSVLQEGPVPPMALLPNPAQASPQLWVALLN